MEGPIRIPLFLAAALTACGSTSPSSSPSAEGGSEPQVDASPDAGGGSEPGAAEGGGASDASSEATPASVEAGAVEAGASEGGGATDSGLAASCTASGGSVSTSLCCGSASDYPNNCSIGACSCAPSSSHMVQVCNCPPGKCFDGSSCR